MTEENPSGQKCGEVYLGGPEGSVRGRRQRSGGGRPTEGHMVRLEHIWAGEGEGQRLEEEDLARREG